jgi:hypothetical protein
MQILLNLYYNAIMNKKNILLIIVLTFVSLIIVYFLIPKNTDSQFLDVIRNRDLSVTFLPKFENPITGEFINSNEKPEFLNRKPLGVMINNAVPARPQAGISEADIVYEIVAEGGITRFLAFYLSNLPEKVGPIRSVREYYLTIVKELGDSLLMHIGYSPQALQRISDWNILSLGQAGADFYRDDRGNPEVATEHTAFANAKDLYTYAQAIKFNTPSEFKVWKFNEEINLSGFETANLIKIDFWYEGDYSAVFKYDPLTEEYIRYSGVIDNVPQILIDDLNKKEIRVKNLVVQFANEVPITGDNKGRLDYEMIDSGNALVFRNGIVTKSIWKKNSLEDRTTFYDLNNNEIEFNRGKFWVSVVPSRNENQVKYTQQ